MTASAIAKKDKELRAICSFENKGKKDFSDYYGIGYWYKVYAGFPQHLPVKLYCDHAPTLQETLLPFDISTPYKKALFHNNLKVADNKERQHFKKVYIAGSAFVHYRKMHHIEKSKNPKGTICFPLHPTAVIDVMMDYDAYMDELLQLPKKFHPFTICLYYLDIEKGVHKKFLERGFDVVTAGHMYDYRFPIRFYDFLKDKQYVTSNAYGSFVTYAIEMGIPFFFYGQTENIKLNNRGDTGIRMGVNTLNEHIHLSKKVSNYQKAEELFKIPKDTPTKEQIEFANFILGVNHQINARKLKIVLWREYYIYIINNKKNNFMKRVKRKLFSFVSPELKKLYKRKRGLSGKTEYQLLKDYPRHTKTEVTLLDRTIDIPDSASFLSMHSEIFKEGIYKFNSNSDTPYIIDGGANIGLATIYLKNRFPNAEILAFEPDEYILNFLKSNIDTFALNNVEIIEKGLWNNNTELEFVSEGADSGVLASLNKEAKVSSKISVVSLKPYLNRKVDFLKLDIEGAETIVLKDIEQQLINVDRIFVEYHSFIGKEQTLNEIIEILTNAKFRLQINSPGLYNKSPFINVSSYNNMDMQLNIFGFKVD